MPDPPRIPCHSAKWPVTNHQIRLVSPIKHRNDAFETTSSWLLPLCTTNCPTCNDCRLRAYLDGTRYMFTIHCRALKWKLIYHYWQCIQLAPYFSYMYVALIYNFLFQLANNTGKEIEQQGLEMQLSAKQMEIEILLMMSKWVGWRLFAYIHWSMLELISTLISRQEISSLSTNN